MMKPRGHCPRSSLVLCAALAACLAIPVGAATPRDYSYLFVQGRVGESFENRPLEDIRVRLVAGSERFETTTDHRGVFIFEKLPVGDYDVELRTLDGLTVEGTWQIDLGERDRVRVRIKLGKRAGERIRIEATEVRVAIHVPEPSTKWGKLWKELGIFLGVAAALAV